MNLCFRISIEYYCLIFQNDDKKGGKTQYGDINSSQKLYLAMRYFVVGAPYALISLMEWDTIMYTTE